jgi:hypothetical protein
MPREKRIARMEIRVSEPEKKLFQAEARRLGLPFAEYSRQVLSGQLPGPGHNAPKMPPPERTEHTATAKSPEREPEPETNMSAGTAGERSGHFEIFHLDMLGHDNWRGISLAMGR